MRLRPSFNFEEMVKLTPGYVGADVQTLCKEASIIAVERIITGENATVKGKRVKTREEVMKAMVDVTMADLKDPEDISSDSDQDLMDLEQLFIELEDF